LLAPKILQLHTGSSRNISRISSSDAGGTDTQEFERACYKFAPMTHPELPGNWLSLPL